MFPQERFTSRRARWLSAKRNCDKSARNRLHKLQKCSCRNIVENSTVISQGTLKIRPIKPLLARHTARLMTSVITISVLNR